MAQEETTADALLKAAATLAEWVAKNHETHSAAILRDVAAAANEFAEAAAWVKFPARDH